MSTLKSMTKAELIFLLQKRHAELDSLRMELIELRKAAPCAAKPVKPACLSKTWRFTKRDGSEWEATRTGNITSSHQVTA